MQIEKTSGFGHLFKELRQTKGYSIKKLAPELGVNYSYISKIENGHTVPSEEFIEKASLLFGYDREELLLRAGRIPEDVMTILKDNPKKAVEYLRRTFGD